MCGFFSLFTGLTARELADIFGFSNLPKSEADLKSLKFYPKSLIPTVSKNSPNSLVFRYWSIIPRWWKDDPYRVKFATFNARAEDLRTKATYKIPWNSKQRCLIPATWFYEFQPVTVEGEKKLRKLPYRVQVKNEEVIALAGLYEIWKDAEGQPIESCTIITCESLPPLKDIHPRQPVIIAKDKWEVWLDKTTPLDTAYEMLKPTPDLEVLRIDEGFNRARGKEVTEEIIKPQGKVE
jgi:putative SOS response-associated peptidase YedK